jgi:uncharacterized SAM-binding protein YcdF (DUF218 family)
MFRLLKIVLLIAFIAAVMFLSHGFLLTKAGEFLVKKDEMKPADVIVILAGEDERVPYGTRLLKEGWARKDRVIMAGGPVVWKHSWASLMKEHAESLGLPARNILLEDKGRTTEEDAFAIRDLLKKYGYQSIVLVTSPYHSRRAAIIFGKVLEKDITIVNAPVEESWFRAHDWWKRNRDRSRVLEEYAKLLWLWIFGVQEKGS